MIRQKGRKRRARKFGATIPTMADKKTEVTVSGAASAFVQDVVFGAHRLTADEPVEVGGNDLGPGPYELLLAALGTCTSMTLGLYARNKKLPLERVVVHLAHGKAYAQDCAECETKAPKLDRIERRIELHGQLDAAQRARLIEIANRCPVHRTLSSNIQIETSEMATAAG
jgi:putative redox protein